MNVKDDRNSRCGHPVRLGLGSRLGVGIVGVTLVFNLYYAMLELQTVCFLERKPACLYYIHK